MRLDRTYGPTFGKNAIRFMLIAASGALVLAPIAASAAPSPKQSSFVPRKAPDGPAKRKTPDGPATRTTPEVNLDHRNPVTEPVTRDDTFTMPSLPGVLARFVRAKRT